MTHLKNAATIGLLVRAEELVGQAEAFDEPVEHERLQLGGGRTRRPREAQTIDGVRNHVAEQTRERVQRRKVGVHVRALPMRYLFRVIFCNIVKN